MNKIKDNFLRTKNMISADKSPIPLECKELAQKDLIKTLSEYFSLIDEVEFDVTTQGGQYSIKLICKADRIKTFSTLK